MRELLHHLLGPVVWSLATPKGRIYKSMNSKLLDGIEERIETVDKIPSKSARIYDGCASCINYLNIWRCLEICHHML